MAEELKKKIYEFLKKNAGQRFHMKDLSRKTKISYPSILKWTAVLAAESSEIIVEDHGNIKFIMIKENGI